MKLGFRPCARASRRRPRCVKHRCSTSWGKLHERHERGDDGCAAALQPKRLSDSTPFTSSKRGRAMLAVPEWATLSGLLDKGFPFRQHWDGLSGPAGRIGNVGIEVLVIAPLGSLSHATLALPGTSTSANSSPWGEILKRERHPTRSNRATSRAQRAEYRGNPSQIVNWAGLNRPWFHAHLVTSAGGRRRGR